MSLMSAAEASPAAPADIEFLGAVPVPVPAPRAAEPGERVLRVTELYFRELQVRQANGAVHAARRQPVRPASAALRRAPARPAPVRLTRRGRTVVTILALLAACAAVMVLWLAEAGAAQASSPGRPAGSVYQGMTRVVVQPGQTVWALASAAEPSARTQAVVQQIIDANALRADTIYAGEMLWVPKA